MNRILGGEKNAPVYTHTHARTYRAKIERFCRSDRLSEEMRMRMGKKSEKTGGRERERARERIRNTESMAPNDITCEVYDICVKNFSRQIKVSYLIHMQLDLSLM